jgi:hypothetical protein
MGLNNYDVKTFSITKLIFNPLPKLDLHMNFVLTLTTVAVLFLTAFVQSGLGRLLPIAHL